MYSVFVSYRRSDVPEVAKEVADACIARLGANKVFFDSSVLRPGDRWTSELTSASEECDVMLVIIGPNWLGEPPKKLKNKLMKKNRLWDNNDYVYDEIHNTLFRLETNSNLIIPVLVGDARLPDEKELPDMVRSFLSNQSFQISLNNKATDIKSLVDYIDKKLPEIAENTNKDRKSYQRNTLVEFTFYIVSRLIFIGAIGYGIYWLIKTLFF